MGNFFRSLIARFAHTKVGRICIAAFILSLLLVIGLGVYLKSNNRLPVSIPIVNPVKGTTADGSIITKAANPSTASTGPAANPSNPAPGASPTPPATPPATTPGSPSPAPSPSPGASPNPTPNPTPSPSPGGGGNTCNGSTHVAGGMDAWGGCWPGSSNTGVPAGTNLTTYSGPTYFSSGTTTINAKTINDDLQVAGTGRLIITNSVLNGHIDADASGATVSVTDTTINAGSWTGPAVGFQNVTLLRVNITGGQHSVLCGDNCSVSDSWLHDQYNTPGGSDHNNGYLSNGGSNVTVRHNTIYCEPLDNQTGGGCTGDLDFIADFAAITNITADKNLLYATAGGTCAGLGYSLSKPYGANPSNVAFTNNYLQKGSSGHCGFYFAISGYLNANGNTCTNNKYTDGTIVSC